MCLALPALHAFTGNDYTSAFYGTGKGKAFKIIQESEEFQECFAKFGDSFTFDAALFPTINKFVFKLYGMTSCTTTDEARYKSSFLERRLLSHKTFLPHKMRFFVTANVWPM